MVVNTQGIYNNKLAKILIVINTLPVNELMMYLQQLWDNLIEPTQAYRECG